VVPINNQPVDLGGENKFGGLKYIRYICIVY
jgi:hypothetical protein